MNISTITDIKIIKVTEQLQGPARDLILEGFKERFGFIDYSFNPDLKNIYTYYNKAGNAFFIGVSHSQVICTGALTRETLTVGRIERMSVKKSYRRKGIAQMMLIHLESHAKKMGYSKLVMETNKEWFSAINLYQTNGYVKYKVDTERIHLAKYLT